MLKIEVCQNYIHCMVKPIERYWKHKKQRILPKKKKKKTFIRANAGYMDLQDKKTEQGSFIMKVIHLYQALARPAIFSSFFGLEQEAINNSFSQMIDIMPPGPLACCLLWKWRSCTKQTIKILHFHIALLYHKILFDPTYLTSMW